MRSKAKRIRFHALKIVPYLSVGLLAAASLGSATTFNPGEIFQIDFTVHPLWCPDGSCDALLFAPNYTGFSDVTPKALLYDGATLLGTDNGSGGCCVAAFESSTSAYDVGAVADFTSIQNGTIQGVFDYFVAGGSLQAFDPSTSLFTIGHADGPGDLSSDSLAFTINSETIIGAAPEPAPASLVPAILVFFCLAGRTHRRPAPAV